MRDLYERVVDIARGAALMTGTELVVDFDGASAEILPNEVLEKALHANVEALGGVPYDDQDQQQAAQFLATVTDDEVRSARLSGGLTGDDPLFGGVAPLWEPGHRQRLTGSTDVGDVSWTTPTVQIIGGTHAVATPLHSWQFVAQGKLPDDVVPPPLREGNQAEQAQR